jgi:16S rRNA (guanine966-N2)-methyltransferase
MKKTCDSFVKVIAGSIRGKHIPFQPLDGLRPTGARIRETLFNWLMHDIQGARCLDVFAGSGILGIEALSRGASHCTFIENNRQTAWRLKQTLQALTFQYDMAETTAENYLSSASLAFDMIFLDPPFQQNLWLDTIQLIEKKQLLSKGGLLYMEAPFSLTSITTHFHLLKEKNAGNVFYGLFKESS